jgi:hypothetical protein
MMFAAYPQNLVTKSYLDERFNQFEKRLEEKFDQKLVALEKRLEEKFDQKLVALEKRLEEKFDKKFIELDRMLDYKIDRIVEVFSEIMQDKVDAFGDWRIGTDERIEPLEALPEQVQNHEKRITVLEHTQ